MARGEVILQLNVQGLTTSKQDLVTLVDELTSSIIALQETLQSDKCLNILGGYHYISKEGHYNRLYHKRIAKYIHSSLLYEEVTVDTPLQVVCILTSFVTVYMQRSINITKQ